MPSASSVLLLADAPEVIPTLAAWYKNEWPACFAETPLEAIEADFHSAANRDCLPLAIVAFDVTGVPMGVCSVRAHPFEPYPYVSPWLRGLYVSAPFCGQGIAGVLIRAAAAHAARLEISKLYASTSSAIRTFERAGWLGFDQVRHDGETLTLFAKRTGEVAFRQVSGAKRT